MTERNARRTIFTIGHSTHEIGAFMGLLQLHGIEAIADVRSRPYSRWQPQFNREELQSALKARGIAYVFLGKELGARSADPACYDEEGCVDYRKLAGTNLFQAGLRRVRDGARRMRMALMCAEKEPLECHRTILIGRELTRDGGSHVEHILASGALETHESAMKRLIGRKRPSRQQALLPFPMDEEWLDSAYSEQEKRIAYRDESRAKEAQGAGE